jgi:hypothetical protein
MNKQKEDLNFELARIKDKTTAGNLLNEEDLKIILLNLLSEEDLNEG